MTLNPSWEAVRLLHDTTLFSEPLLDGVSSNDSPSLRRPSRPIHFSASFLPVTYSSVSLLAPALQNPPEPDLIIHVGVSSEDRSIRLEQRARKFGYDSTDAEGQMAELGEDGRRGFVGERWRECPEELRTRVEGGKVVRRLKEAGFEHISLSEDAGTYRSPFHSLLYPTLTCGNRRPLPLRIHLLHLARNRPPPSTGRLPNTRPIYPHPSVRPNFPCAWIEADNCAR